MLEDVFRDEWGRVLAALVSFLRDFDEAEEAAQEAFAIAAQRWPVSGVPDRLDAVLAVLYLTYNEGYSGRLDLGAEAIRLGQVLVTLMPGEPEAYGLQATPPRLWPRSTVSTWTATSTSTPPAVHCCAASAATTRLAGPTVGPWTWPPRPPRDAS